MLLSSLIVFTPFTIRALRLVIGARVMTMQKTLAVSLPHLVDCRSYKQTPVLQQIENCGMWYADLGKRQAEWYNRALY